MTPLTAYFGLLGFVALTRIIELRVSGGRVDKLSEETRERATDWNYVAMVVVHTVLFILPAAEAVWLDTPLTWWLAGPALAVLLAATLLRVRVITLLGPSWNTRGVVDPDIAVVTTGPYRWVRHPNYLAVIAEIAALPLVYGCWRSALLLSIANGLVLVGRIRREEDELGQIPAWREAFAHKPRVLPNPFLREPGAAATP